MRGRHAAIAARRFVIAFVVAVLYAASAAAHDGHVHTLRGTVVEQDARQLQIKTTDGKVQKIALNEKTTFTQGTKKVERTALTKGLRVVVDVGNGKEPLVARSVKLGQ